MISRTTTRTLQANRMATAAVLRAQRVYLEKSRPRSYESSRVQDCARFDDEPAPTEDMQISKWRNAI